MVKKTTNEGESHRDFSLTHCLPFWKCPSTGFHDTHSPCFLLTSQLAQIYCSSDSFSSFSHYLNIIFPCRLYLASSSLYTLLRILHRVSPTTDGSQIPPLSQHCSLELQNQVYFSLLDRKKPCAQQGTSFSYTKQPFPTRNSGVICDSSFFLSFPKCNCSICPVETTAYISLSFSLILHLYFQ